MIGAAAWHASRSEGAQIGQNIIIGFLLAVVAYGRWKLEPIAPRDQSTARTS